MENTTIATINNVSITMVSEDTTEQYIPIKPICEAIGVDSWKQIEQIKRDGILASFTTCRVVTEVDGKQSEMVCLPLKYIFGWLFTINLDNIKEEARENMISYKMECYEALYTHFYGKVEKYQLREKSFKRTILLQNEQAMLKCNPNKTGEDFERYLEIERELAINEMLDSQGIIKQNVKTKEDNALSGFWTILKSLVRSVQIIEGVDYKIKGLPVATALEGYSSKVNLDPDKRYLLFNFKNIVPAYMKEGCSTWNKVLPKASLLYYLQNSPEYIGVKKSERFERIAYVNSTVTESTPFEIRNNNKKASFVTTCMVFDYEALLNKYDLSIDEYYVNSICNEDIVNIVPLKEQ